MPRKTPARRPLPGFGVRGRIGTKGTAGRPSTAVRVVLETGQVRVLWSERGQRRKESRPDTDANRDWARAFAEGVYEELRRRAAGVPDAPRYAALTLRQLWELYLVATPQLRPKTLTNYTERWVKLEHFAGRDKIASEVTRETLDRYAADLRTSHEGNQVREIVKTAVRVFRFGVERDLLPATKVTAYRVKLARGEGPRKIPEYTAEEARRLVAQFDPKTPLGWKPYVATYLFALTGGRQNAVRHFTWDDVDLGTLEWTADGEPMIRGASITYRAELDKMGEGRTQPVPAGVAWALHVALGWRQAYQYTGPYILFRPALGVGEFDARTGRVLNAARAQATADAADKPWSYDAYLRQLHAAEAAASPKVETIKYRGAHAFRRHVLNNALEATGGNLALAGQYIGDRDLATLSRSYVRPRDAQLRGLADRLHDPLEAPRPEPRSGANRTATALPETAQRPADGPGAASAVLLPLTERD